MEFERLAWLTYKQAINVLSGISIISSRLKVLKHEIYWEEDVYGPGARQAYPL